MKHKKIEFQSLDLEIIKYIVSCSSALLCGTCIIYNYII